MMVWIYILNNMKIIVYVDIKAEGHRSKYIVVRDIFLKSSEYIIDVI